MDPFFRIVQLYALLALLLVAFGLLANGIVVTDQYIIAKACTTSICRDLMGIMGGIAIVICGFGFCIALDALLGEDV